MNSEIFFYELGQIFTVHPSYLSQKQGLRRFKDFYGVSPKICSVLWALIESNIEEYSQPKHLLWSLCFLKQYHTETTNRAIFVTDEKTFRKHVWLMIKSIANLDVIKFEERFHDSQYGQVCFTSLDGVDFKVRQPKPFNKNYFSHKFKASALRYEIGIALRTGNIVWIGGYPAGELALADKGYNDPNYFITPDATNAVGHKQIMSRHETVNKRIRQFKVLFNTFHHRLDKHTQCFNAVVNITALKIRGTSFFHNQ